MRRSQNQGILSEKILNPVGEVKNVRVDFDCSVNETNSTGVSNDWKTKKSVGENRNALSKVFSCFDGKSISDELNLFITTKEFSDRFGKSSTVIIDCRSQIDFSAERIRSAHNINCRSKLISRKLVSKKLEEIEPSLSNFLKSSDSLILYDQSTEISTEEQIRSAPIYLVVQAARRSNKKVQIVQGGFQALKNQFPQFVQTSCRISLTEEDFSSNVFTPEPIDKENFVMTQILPQIFVGNAFDSQDEKRLEKFGISHVINATPDLPFAPNVRTLRIPVFDSPTENILNHFQTAIDFIDEAICCQTNNVLVHCSAGISRSPTLVLAFMIKKENLTVEEAISKMRNSRSIIDPNFSFISQLRTWEKKSRTKIETIEENRTTNNSTIHQTIPRSRSNGQFCGSNSTTKNDGQTAIVVN